MFQPTDQLEYSGEEKQEEKPREPVYRVLGKSKYSEETFRKLYVGSNLEEANEARWEHLDTILITTTFEGQLPKDYKINVDIEHVLLSKIPEGP